MADLGTIQFGVHLKDYTDAEADKIKKKLENLSVKLTIDGKNVNISHTDLIKKQIEDAVKSVSVQSVKVDASAVKTQVTSALQGVNPQISVTLLKGSLGNDLLLGAEVDTLLSRKGEMFSPAHAEDYMAGAVVLRSDGSERPLVKETFRYPVMQPITNESSVITPNMVALLLMVLTGVCTWHEWRKKKIGKIGNVLDILLTLLQGGAGCIIALLFFCSEHPAVGSNWLVMWLNPLPLLWLPLQIWRTRHGKRDIYSPVLIGVLLLFCLCGCMGVQHFPTAVWALASVLLMRACARTFINIGQRHK